MTLLSRARCSQGAACRLLSSSMPLIFSFLSLTRHEASLLCMPCPTLSAELLWHSEHNVTLLSLLIWSLSNYTRIDQNCILWLHEDVSGSRLGKGLGEGERQRQTENLTWLEAQDLLWGCWNNGLDGDGRWYDGQEHMYSRNIAELALAAD